MMRISARRSSMHFLSSAGEGGGLSHSIEKSRQYLLIDNDASAVDGVLALINPGGDRVSIIRCSSLDQVMQHLEFLVPDLIIFARYDQGTIDEEVATIRTLNRATPIALPLIEISSSGVRNVRGIVMLKGDLAPLVTASGQPENTALPWVSSSLSNSSEVAGVLSSGLHSNGTPPFHLTPREQDILSAIARGLSNKEIARQLDLSPGTVKNYVAKLLQIYEVSSRTKLLAKIAANFNVT